MTLYGLRGLYHHGWSKVLTVMSPEGATAALAHMSVAANVRIDSCEGRLTKYLEQGKGALDQLVESYGIIVLTKLEWDQKKAELGEAIWR